jgi:hypothetical protein
MVHHITASAETLMTQGSMTAHDYVCEGIRRIDQELGEGYAKKNPVLLAGFIQAASMDCSAATIAAQIRAGLEDSGPGYLNEMAQAEGLSDIAEALKEVATAIYETHP